MPTQFRNLKSSTVCDLRAGTPLTPALSPLRGEGVAVKVSGNLKASLRVLSSEPGPETRRDAPGDPSTHVASPSPLNGERAGVRGVNGTGLPNLRGSATSSHTPKLPPASLMLLSISDFDLRVSFGFRLSDFGFLS